MNMSNITKQEAQRMKDYVVSRLEDSGVYIAQTAGSDSILINIPSRGNTNLYFHTDTLGARKCHSEQLKRRNAGNNIANIFYKDKETFFVPLSEDERVAFGKTTNARYSEMEMHRMIKLRQKESDILDLQGVKTLTYYQPDTRTLGGNLKEGLVNFNFAPVITNYDHIDKDVKGHSIIYSQNNTPLKRRMLVSNRKELNGKLRFVPARPYSRQLILDLEPLEYPFKQVQLDNLKGFLHQTGSKSLDEWGGSLEDIESYINPQ